MIYEEIERARLEFEEQLIPEVADLFGRQGDDMLAAIEAAPSPAWAVLDAERLAGDVSVASEALYLVWGIVGPSFARAAYEGLTEAKRAPSEDEWLNLVLEFLQREGAVMVRAITDTVLEDIRRVLVEGAEEGESVQQMARRLREAWPEITMRRAERIVRTEVVGASNRASLMGYERAAQDFGLDLELEWIATKDGRTRDSHRRLDGERVPLGGMFEVGGYPAAYPGDPSLPAAERVNCRCTTAAVPKDMKAVVIRLDTMNDRERQRVELAMRDMNIRAQYPAMKEELGQLGAIARLAEMNCISESTVKAALWGR